jgi:LysR family transcriptional regulator, glycine cleavage system transcriptional activator
VIPDSDPDPDAATRPRISLQMAEDWSNVRAYKLMPDVLVPVCSPELMKDVAQVHEARELLQLPLLHMATRVHAWPDWFRASGVDYDIAAHNQAYGHFFMVLDAALSGRGVALVPRMLAAPDIQAGRLIVPLDLEHESAGAYHMLCRDHQADSATVKAFREWLFAQRDDEHASTEATDSFSEAGL